MKNNQRYIILSFLAFAVALGFAVRGLAGPILASQEIADPTVFGTVELTDALGVSLGILSFIVLLRSASGVAFTDEVISELRKVVWPQREDTFRSTTIVIGTSLFLALALAGFDWVWGSLTSAFLFTEG